MPTSLACILLSARGCEPRRPDADMGTFWHENYSVSLGFSRVGGNAPDTTRAVVLYGCNVPISGQADSREFAPYKEKRTLPGAPANVSELVCVAALGPPAKATQSPCPGSGILTRFPFGTVRTTGRPQKGRQRLRPSERNFPMP